MSLKEERETRKELQRLNARSSRQSSNNRMLLWGIAAVIVVVGIGLIISQSTGDDDSPLLKDPAKITENDWKRGAVIPQVTLLEYSDLQCPACKAYEPVLKQLLQNYPTQLALVYRHYPLTTHKNSIPAAMAAEAAGIQNKFFEMNAILFDRQSEWAELPNPRSKFESYAQELGLDIVRWEESYSSKELRDKIGEHRKSGDKLRVQGTPTFWLNGNKIDNPNSFEEFKQLIENQLATTPKPVASASTVEHPTPFHGHANFLVLVEGKLLDFSTDTLQSTHEKELDSDVHLHNKKGGIAHIHKENTTWQEFFQSLGMDLTTDCFRQSAAKEFCVNEGKKLSVILNDTPLSQWENLPMHDLDRLLVSFGNSIPAQLSEQFKKVPDDACIYSEKCPERGKPAEKEPCAGGLGTKCD